MEAQLDTVLERGADQVVDGPVAGQYVNFVCDNRSYAVDIMQVREIRSWSPVTALPEQPQGACGVLDIRGEVVQVYDLSLLMGGPAIEMSDGHVVLVLALPNQTIGILVDGVSDIIEVGESDIRKPPPGRTNGTGMVKGVVKREEELVAILELQPVFDRMAA